VSTFAVLHVACRSIGAADDVTAYRHLVFDNGVAIILGHRRIINNVDGHGIGDCIAIGVGGDVGEAVAGVIPRGVLGQGVGVVTILVDGKGAMRRGAAAGYDFQA